MICASIYHLASRSHHPYGVRTINLEECCPFPWNLPADLTFTLKSLMTNALRTIIIHSEC